MAKYELTIVWTWQEFATEDRDLKTGHLLVEQDVRIEYTFSDPAEDFEIIITRIQGLTAGDVVFPLPEWALTQAVKTLPTDDELQQRMEEAGWIAVYEGRAASVGSAA